MKLFQILLPLILVYFLTYEATASDKYVNVAKSLSAQKYDNTLPPIQVDQWLKEIIPDHLSIKWGEYITACGEQSGNPQTDKNRNFPLCAEVLINQNNNNVGYLLLFIGAEKQGDLEENASLYYGFIKIRNEQITINTLSELKKINWN